MSSLIESQFEPYIFSEKVEALLDLQGEIRDKGTEIFSLYYDSIAGYEMLIKHLADWKHDRITSLERAGINADAEAWDDLESFPISPPPHGHGSDFQEFARTLQDYRYRLMPAGRNGLLVGNFLLIALYQHWEDSWRVRIARSLKLADKNLIMSDFWSDLRLIRICLIHKKGLADSGVANKCVLFRWFKEGDEIVIDRQKTERIICEFFRFLHEGLMNYERIKA